MLVLDQLVQSLRSASIYNRNENSRPSVILWTDGDRHWQHAMDMLAPNLPELLILDEEVEQAQRGPSTWIRYQLSRRDTKQLPVVYLPGIPRHAFRMPQGFPEHARHLFALQYEGQFWSQSNGRDWSLLAFFLSQDGGLGLEIARDAETLKVLSDQLQPLLQTPLSMLQQRYLDAKQINALVTEDPVRQLLQWVGDPDAARKGMGESGWKAFRAVCKSDYQLDPAKASPLAAAERLVASSGPWKSAWNRYAESPRSFTGIRKALDSIKPKDLFDPQNAHMPSHNWDREVQLRTALCELSGLPLAKAKARLTELVEQHAPRAEWVWAELGEAPLARASVWLQCMLKQMQAGIAGDSWKEWAEHYLEAGWQVDFSAWKAWSCVTIEEDLQAVSTALRAVYLPWLEALGERVQLKLESYPQQATSQARTLPIEAGTLLLFVDGLRADLTMHLVSNLTDAGYTVDPQVAWAALPTVTASAKPAWLPLAEGLSGANRSEGFEPQGAKGKPFRTAEFRNRLKELGLQVALGDVTPDPARPCWTEAGSFDHMGHDLGAKFASQLDSELEQLVHRIKSLLAQGWKKIVVLTDHGWLWMPGGLPKTELPKHLTTSRWSRCALPDPAANHTLPQVNWYWGNEHAIAIAPGVSCFIANQEYAHGGLTLQEALTVDLVVTAGSQASAGSATIVSSQWMGLRLRLTVKDAEEGSSVDLRRFAGDPTSSYLDRTRAIEADGAASFLLEDDDLLGETATIVVLDGNRVLCEQLTTIGENDS